MFEGWILFLIIGIVAAKIHNMVKTKSKKEQQRLDEIMRNVEEFKRERLARSRNLSATGTSSSMLAAAAGGAATMFLLDHIMHNNDLDQQTIAQMQAMDMNQLQEFAMENEYMQQEEMHELMDQYVPFDPYTNPGTDLVVDEFYHDIDHGLDDDYHYGADDYGNDDFGGMDNNFGGGFDDFGGGFGGGFGNDF